MSSSIKMKLLMAGAALLLIALLRWLDWRNQGLGKQEKRPTGVFRYATGPYYQLYTAIILFFLYHLEFLITPGEFIPFLHAELTYLFLLLPITVLLLVLTPRLRRRFSARACAELWFMPGYIFCGCHFLLSRHLRSEDPLLVIRISGPVLRTAFVIWLAGFFSVLLWRLFSHLQFRKRILQDAVQAEQWEYGLYAQVWQAMVPPADVTYRSFVECSICRPAEAILDRRHIVRSSAVSSPLTIGLLRKTTFLVLPDRSYSEDELGMIFMHEIVHLLRDDVRTKLFLTLICAAGWFIPSLWFGLGMASEDLELCCDELVTEGMGNERRRQYAGLLLQASGTERGFTSCLSASARGFRYRLKRVLHPRRQTAKQYVGVFLLALFVLLMGSFGIQARLGTVQSAILDEGWQVYAVRDAAQHDYSTDPALAASVEAQLRDRELERVLWKDNQKPHEFDVHDYPDGELYVVLARENGEKMLLRVFKDRIVVHAGGFELNGECYPDDSKPTVYLLGKASSTDSR